MTIKLEDKMNWNENCKFQMAEVSLTNSLLTFVPDLRQKFYQRSQPFDRGQCCVFEE